MRNVLDTPSAALRTAAALLGAVLFLAAAPLAAQVSITMEIQMEKKGKRVEKHDVTTTLVGDGERGAIHTETADGSVMTMIVDAGARHTTTVVTDGKGERSAVRMPNIKVPKSQRLDAGFDGDLERTGETRTILGHRAEEYIVRDGGDVTEVWIADVPGYDYNLIVDGLGQAGAGADAPEVDGMEYPVALESHTTSKGGKEVAHMYVRAIAVGGDVDLSMMEVPPGVELMDMSAMLKGLGGGR